VARAAQIRALCIRVARRPNPRGGGVERRFGSIATDHLGTIACPEKRQPLA
jgi:hypothetical protein